MILKGPSGQLPLTRRWRLSCRLGDIDSRFTSLDRCIKGSRGREDHNQMLLSDWMWLVFVLYLCFNHLPFICVTFGPLGVTGGVKDPSQTTATDPLGGLIFLGVFRGSLLSCGADDTHSQEN